MGERAFTTRGMTFGASRFHATPVILIHCVRDTGSTPD
jgi:hypothetical protein